MAIVWRVYDGKDPTNGSPWLELPFEDVVQAFSLTKNDLVSDITITPRFGDASRDLWFSGFKHIVVEIDRAEAKKYQWSPGFYRAKVKPSEARNHLLRQSVARKMGEDNVVRVESAPASDSTGNDNARVTIVLSENAIGRLSGDSVLNAVVSLRERLRALGDERSPLIQYATESELKQNASR